MTPQEIHDTTVGTISNMTTEAFWMREIALQLSLHNEREQLRMKELDDIQEKLKSLVGQGAPGA